MYKIILAEKDSEVKRMKEKYNKRIENNKEDKVETQLNIKIHKNSNISSLNNTFSKLCKKLLEL